MWCNLSYSNIKNFQIEGMSIGDSFLTHYNAEDQKKLNKITDEKNETITVRFTSDKFILYDELQVVYNIKNQKIKSIVGILYLIDQQYAKDWMGSINICLEEQNKVTNELSFGNPKIIKLGELKNHPSDKSGKSKYKINDILLAKNGKATVSCYDWSAELERENNWKDSFTVSLIEEEISSSIASADNILPLVTTDKNIKNTKFTNNDKNYALLISNSNYDFWSDLNSPNKDVNAISSILKNDYKFNVEIIKDRNRSEILDKIFEYSNKITSKDNLLIYYVGHGEIVNSNAYWIPKNASKEISSNWLNTKDVESAISMISAKDLLVMIDACFQGTAFKSGENKIIGPTNNEMNDEKYFKKMLNFRSAIVITSGSNEPVVDATVEGHSQFAFKFIDILKRNNLYQTSTSLFVKIKKYHANLQQSPNLFRVTNWGDLGGEFIFVKNNNN